MGEFRGLGSMQEERPLHGSWARPTLPVTSRDSAVGNSSGDASTTDKMALEGCSPTND